MFKRGARTLADIRERAEDVTLYRNDRDPRRFTAYGTVRGRRIEYVLHGEYEDPAAAVIDIRSALDVSHLILD